MISISRIVRLLVLAPNVLLLFLRALLSATITSAMTDLLDPITEATDSLAAASIDWNEYLPITYKISGDVEFFIDLLTRLCTAARTNPALSAFLFASEGTILHYGIRIYAISLVTLFPSITPFPSSLLPAARLRPGTIDATLAARRRRSPWPRRRGSALLRRQSPDPRSALVRPAINLPSDSRGQPRRLVPTTAGSSNKCAPPAISQRSETGCDKPPPRF